MFHQNEWKYNRQKLAGHVQSDTGQELNAEMLRQAPRTLEDFLPCLQSCEIQSCSAVWTAAAELRAPAVGCITFLSVSDKTKQNRKLWLKHFLSDCPTNPFSKIYCRNWRSGCCSQLWEWRNVKHRRRKISVCVCVNVCEREGNRKRERDFKGVQKLNGKTDCLTNMF